MSAQEPQAEERDSTVGQRQVEVPSLGKVPVGERADLGSSISGYVQPADQEDPAREKNAPRIQTVSGSADAVGVCPS